MILDLDNTLIEPGEKKLGARVLKWIESARDMGFSVCILSNSPRNRVVRVSSGVGIYAVASARKPAEAGFLKALRLMGLKPSQACAIGDQLFTDVLGAKRLGIMAIYTSPITKREEIAVTLKRFPEKYLLKRYMPSE
jgi:HAD superfamily phosphatase (TIGR01668 family)